MYNVAYQTMYNVAHGAAIFSLFLAIWQYLYAQSCELEEDVSPFSRSTGVGLIAYPPNDLSQSRQGSQSSSIRPSLHLYR